MLQLQLDRESCLLRYGSWTLPTSLREANRYPADRTQNTGSIAAVVRESTMPVTVPPMSAKLATLSPFAVTSVTSGMLDVQPRAATKFHTGMQVKCTACAWDECPSMSLS